MDQFYKFLREIQKKERNKSALARVEEDFYNSIHDYLDELRETAGNDPFSTEHSLFKESQMVANEICQRREHKITDAAVINIHRSFHLFTGKPKFDLLDTTPINLTPEEERFYFSLIDSLKNHRMSISIDKISENDFTEEKLPKDQKTIIKNKNPIKSEKKKTNKSIDKISKATFDENQQANKKENIPSQDNFSDIYDNIDNQFNDNLISNNKTILVFDNIDAIMGTDGKEYGPFRPQDVVILPSDNAKVFTKYKKARFVKI